MTDHELDQAVNSAFDAVDARSDLKNALALFVSHAEKAGKLLDQAIRERGNEIRTEDVRTTERLLKTELLWAKHLRGLILDHDHGSPPS